MGTRDRAPRYVGGYAVSVVMSPYASPIGMLYLYAQDDCIIRLDFVQSSAVTEIPLLEGVPEGRGGFVKYLTNRGVIEGYCQALDLLRRELDAYFAGALTAFTVPYRLYGTDFQRTVWERLKEIPYGQTVTYGQLAERIGKPRASRAVGGANHNNPISIVIPCHRVVGAGGRLTGYGGGLDRKAFLLRLESGGQ